MTALSHLNIVVAGAGPGGLGTALALSRAGFKHVVVVDRMQSPAPLGSGLVRARI